MAETPKPTRDDFLVKIRGRLLQRMAGQGSDPDTVPTLLDHAARDDSEEPPVLFEAEDTPAGAPGRQSLPTVGKAARGEIDRDDDLLQLVQLVRGAVSRQDTQAGDIAANRVWAEAEFRRVRRAGQSRLGIALGVIVLGVAGGFVSGALACFLTFRTLGWLLLP